MDLLAYQLRFADGILFQGPSVLSGNPQWADEHSTKAVERMSFRVGESLYHLEGFDAYNLFVEASQSFGGGSAPARIERVYFLAAKRGRVVRYCIDLRAKNLVIEALDWGKEYGGGKTRGWRPGILNAVPRIRQEYVQ